MKALQWLAAVAFFLFALAISAVMLDRVGAVNLSLSESQANWLGTVYRRPGVKSEAKEGREAIALSNDGHEPGLAGPETEAVVPPMSDHTEEKPSAGAAIEVPQSVKGPTQTDHSAQAEGFHERVARVRGMLSAMRTTEAARIVSQLDDQIAVSILRGMEDQRVAAILASLEPTRAAALTRAYLTDQPS